MSIRRVVGILGLVCVCGGVMAAEAATVPPPAPAVTSPPAPAIPPPPAGVNGGVAVVSPRPMPSSMGPMAGMMLGTEVEVVVLSGSGNDPDGQARWAELAAVGYRLTQAVADQGSMVLFLERQTMGMTAVSRVRLPAAVARDDDRANKVQARIEAMRQERQGRPSEAVIPAAAASSTPGALAPR